jgi:hypothetical protein
MQCKDEGLVWRSLSDTVASCQLRVSFYPGMQIFSASGYGGAKLLGNRRFKSEREKEQMTEIYH